MRNSLYCKKLKGALHGKETKKDKDKTRILADGKVKVMTTSEVVDKLAAQEAAKKAEAEAKAQRKAARVSKRSAKEEIE